MNLLSLMFPQNVCIKNKFLRGLAPSLTPSEETGFFCSDFFWICFFFQKMAHSIPSLFQQSNGDNHVDGGTGERICKNWLEEGGTAAFTRAAAAPAAPLHQRQLTQKASVYFFWWRRKTQKCRRSKSITLEAHYIGGRQMADHRKIKVVVF